MTKMTLTRRADWRARLNAFLLRAAPRKFSPGRHDCAIFTAGAIQAMTGHDFAAEWRGKYRKLHTGQAKLQEAGFADHIDLAASLLPEVAPSFAKVGDVAVIQGAEDLALGIVQGAGVYCLTPDGLTVVSRLKMLRAFSV